MGDFLGNRKVGVGLFYENGIPVYRLPCLVERGAAILTYGVKKALENFAPDVVHAHDSINPTSVLAALHKRSLRYKLVVDEHMVIDDFPRTPWMQLAYTFYKKLAFSFLSKRADGFIAITPAVFRWLQKEIGISSQLITLVPLGANTDLFRRDERYRTQYRNLLHVSDDEVLVTYAGKLLPAKDIDILIKGIAPLIKKYKKMKVLLLGSGNRKYLSEFLTLAKKYKIYGSLILHNLVTHEELARFYSASDVGVWLGRPSNTIIEAMSCCLPIIIAKSEQTRHLIAYNNGISFSRGDSHEFETCLERLIQDENLRHHMGLRSRKLVEDKLSWDIIAKKTLEIYRRILAN